MGGGIGSQIHVKASWNADGSSASVQVGNNHYSGEGYNDVMSQFGGVIYSSQWTGWVPGSCGGDGNLGASSFSVSNVRVQGKVVQGSEPTRCAPLPTPVPTVLPTPVPTTPSPSPPAPVPTPAPTSPSPTPSVCPGGSLAMCLRLCPSDAAGYKACAIECDIKCSSTIVV